MRLILSVYYHTNIYTEENFEFFFASKLKHDDDFKNLFLSYIGYILTKEYGTTKI